MPHGAVHDRHGLTCGVVVDGSPPEPAPGPAAQVVVTGMEVAGGELAAVGPPETPLVLRADGLDPVEVPLGSNGGFYVVPGRRSARGRVRLV